MGGEGHVKGGDVGWIGMGREGWGGYIAMDLVLQSGHITVCSGCLSHILPTSVFKADVDSNIAFAACQTSYKIQACQITLSSEPLPSPPPSTVCGPVLTSASGCTISRSVVKEGETSSPFKVTL